MQEKEEEQLEKPEKINFYERNKQIFELGLILAVLFITLIIIAIFLPKTKPTLVQIDDIEETTESYE